MNPILRNIVAIVVGIILGSIVNMALVMVSSYVIPPPAGADVTTTEGLQASMHLFEIQHYIFPFLAHALGTLAGAFIAARIAASYQLHLALGVGVFFLIGGIAAVMMLPSPLWFSAVDLIVAYLPMAYIGYLLGRRRQSRMNEI